MVVFFILLLVNCYCYSFELDDQELRAQAQELVEAWHAPQDTQSTNDVYENGYEQTPFAMLIYYFKPSWRIYASERPSSISLKVSAEVFRQLNSLKGIRSLYCSYCNQECILQKSNDNQLCFVCTSCDHRTIIEK